MKTRRQGRVRLSIPVGQPSHRLGYRSTSTLSHHTRQRSLPKQYCTVTGALTVFDFSSYADDVNTYDINFANNIVETTVVATPAYGATIDSTTNSGTADIELSVGVNTHEIKIIAEDASH